MRRSDVYPKLEEIAKQVNDKKLISLAIAVASLDSSPTENRSQHGGGTVSVIRKNYELEQGFVVKYETAPINPLDWQLLEISIKGKNSSVFEARHTKGSRPDGMQAVVQYGGCEWHIVRYHPGDWEQKLAEVTRDTLTHEQVRDLRERYGSSLF